MSFNVKYPEIVKGIPSTLTSPRGAEANDDTSTNAKRIDRSVEKSSENIVDELEFEGQKKAAEPIPPVKV